MIKNKKILDALSLGDIDLAKDFLEANIREEYSLNAGNFPSDIKIINKIMKRNRKNFALKEMYKAIPVTTPFGDSFAFMTNYYVVSSGETFGYNILSKDPYTIGDKLNTFLCNTSTYTELAVDLADVKAAKTINKSNNKDRPYKIKTSNGFVLVKPSYLKDVMDFVHTGSICIIDDASHYNNDAYKDFVYLKNEQEKRYGFVLTCRE